MRFLVGGCFTKAHKDYTEVHFNLELSFIVLHSLIYLPNKFKID